MPETPWRDLAVSDLPAGPDRIIEWYTEHKTGLPGDLDDIALELQPPEAVR